jgi:glycosyltransferase involved in cell wall biosynthesis
MISVCVATYNGAAFIRAQLETVLPQLSTDDEVIVSDDGSTDATREVVQEVNDSRIILLEGPRAGLIKNFEYALGHVCGDIVFLCG